MAKMGKLTPEEEARNKMLMRERDRERKRMKRMNPEYRRIEQERDRDRKKARRANEAFRQLEKLRDKLRKERKKGIIVDETALPTEFVSIPPVSVEPEVIISDVVQQPQQTNNRNTSRANGGNNASGASNLQNTTNSTTTTITSAVTSSASTLTPTHLSQLNKGLLYPPPSFPHHPLPIAGVTLMPQLCHPILHQNLSATLYPPNGIKQEYGSNDAAATTPSTSSSNANTGQQVPGGNANNSGSGNGSGSGSGNNATGNNEDLEIALIEPEIILQTSSDIIAAPHHFQNHAHTHHLHQQQCSMFQHMTPQAHMTMRTHAPLAPSSAQHAEQQQQQMQHYAANKGS